MIMLDENDPDTQVFLKAKKRRQQTFTLVAQDPTAPAALAHWIELNIETAPEAKLRDALEDALKMRKHLPRKPAD